jgi:hypothetical protein
MATTTNYGWTTPDDTSLVKDGASAIRSLGSAIDTTVFNNAGAAIAKTIVDAKGDIIAATAADTVSRLAVGANDTVLTADSSTATGLKWATVSAGGMTLINTGGTSLTGSSVTISSIPGTYKYLKLVIVNVVSSVSNRAVDLRMNSDSGNNYSRVSWYTSTDSSSSTQCLGSLASIRLMYNVTDSAGVESFGSFDIFNYTTTTTEVFVTGSFSSEQPAGSFITGTYNNSAAVTSLTLLCSDFSTGTAYLYGVN